MTVFPEISRRPHDKYHNLDDDAMVKNIFNSGKNKEAVGMKIPSWMIMHEMKLMNHCRMYVAVFGVDVSMTQSQPIESTQRTHRTTSSPMSPNPKTNEGESSAPRKSTIIRLHIPPRRLERLTPPTPIPTTANADDIILQDTIQLSLVEQKKGTKNVENVKDDSSTFRQDDTKNIPGTRPFAIRLRDQDDPRDDTHPEGENSVNRQKTFRHRIFMFGESSPRQDFESEPGPSTSGNHEQLDDFDFWTNSYATDDDEIPTEKVSQELVDEMSHTVDETKLCKVVDEMLRQRCTVGDEHQYHVDQMQNFMKNDIVWESRKEILISPHPQNPTPVVQSCQRDPKAHALSAIFPDDDIEERTSRWVEDYAETGLLLSLSVFIKSTVIWERVHDFQLGVESYQQKNNEKEKRVMKHQEIHKFCDATLKRVLEGLKSNNSDVKHGYVTPSLSKEDVEYLQLFEEDIEETLKHQDQMRW
nr:hypothetical protein [Tanacetum cinerariifolium]